MINRPNYIEAINPFIDQPLVKILAGIRRCGKSTIFEMLEEELLRRGVPADHIICKRYTEMDIPENITAKQMYDELVETMAGKGHCYLLLDEIQEINGWEKAVNSLLEGSDADIYVTGSNSKLMSSEISTYLTGRYVSIPVYTLSFREYLDFKAGSALSQKELLEEYADARYARFQMRSLEDYDRLRQVVEAQRKTGSHYVRDRVMKDIPGRSNGESAFLYFTREIQEGGLSLLDEPENSLSPQNQLQLKYFIEDSVRNYGCQFVISTHSPFLLSLHGAILYNIDETPRRTKVDGT